MAYPSQQRLKELLHYSPDSGEFTWIKTNSRKFKVGTRAGCVKTKKYGRQYRQICFDGAACMEHRLAFIYMTGENPEKIIDHIDLVGTNNKWSNLRLVSHKANMKNQKLISSNKSGVCGVHRIKSSGKWCAQICVNGKRMHLGMFDDIREAEAARLEANKKYGFSENHGKELAAQIKQLEREAA